MQNFKNKMHGCCEAAAGETRTSLGKFNSYIPLLSVMTTLHYHISSLEANLSLEDMKQLCVDRSHIHTGRPPNPQN